MKQAKIIIIIAFILDLAFVSFPDKKGQKTFLNKGFEEVLQLNNYRQKKEADYTFKQINSNSTQEFSRGENYSIAGFLNLPE